MKLDAAILERLQGKPGEVTDATFDALVLHAQGPVVVDFWADYCGPCHMVMPLVYKLAHEYAGRVTVLKMDTQANREVFKRYNLRGVPTLLFFLNGEVIEERVGYAGYDDLRDKFEELVGRAGLTCETDVTELAFAAAINAAEEAFETAVGPASEAYQKAAEPFREAVQSAIATARAEKEAGKLDDEGFKAAMEAAYAPMQEATKVESEAYGQAADAAGEARYAAINAAVAAYLG